MTYTHHVIQPQRALRLSGHGTYSSMIVLLCFCFLLITCVWSLYITNWLDCLFVCFFLSLCKISLCFSADEAPSHGFPCFHCDFLLTVGFLIHAMNFDNDMWTDLNEIHTELTKLCPDSSPPHTTTLLHVCQGNGYGQQTHDHTFLSEHLQGWLWVNEEHGYTL